MDGSSFVAAVERLRRVVRPDGERQGTARHLLRTLAHYPEGVTDAIVRCELQQHRKRGSGGRMFTSVEALLRTRHSPPDMLLELRVLTIESDALTLGQNADASEDVGAACLIHFPDERLLACLRGIRQPRVVPGTVLRIARGKTAEHALATRRNSKCNSLLLLPTPHVVLVLQPHLRAEDGVALSSALRDACECVRGEPTLPSSGSLVLRAVRTTDIEHFDGRLLRRVLLERVDLEKLRTAWDISAEGGAATAAPPAASEVEAELVFWDAEQELARFIPDGCLTLIDQPALYTTGSAEPGGAPAQIGYAAVAWKESDHSRLIIVLTLDDGQVAMHCSAHLQVVSELLNVNIEDFSHLSTPKRDEILDGLLVYDRVWALTSGQKREWRVDCGVADLELYTE
ncbi:MAG: hypothetical protein SGPRY_001367 [Prymnesium sp.]